MSDEHMNVERGPEAEDVAKLETALERVRELSTPMLERLAEELRMTQDDVVRLAVVLFGRYLDMTKAKDTFILVVKGSVTAYDTALEALVAGEHGDEPFAALLEHLKHSQDSE